MCTRLSNIQNMSADKNSEHDLQVKGDYGRQRYLIIQSSATFVCQREFSVKLSAL